MAGTAQLYPRVEVNRFERQMMGIYPQVWKNRALWQSDLGDYAYEVMASDCLVALAQSGRPEIWDLLTAATNAPLRANHAPAIPRGAVVDAAFYHHVISTGGVRAVFELRKQEKVISAFAKWRESEAGRAWREWSEQRRKAEGKRFVEQSSPPLQQP